MKSVNFSVRRFLKFLIPSLAGVALFLVPVKFDGSIVLIVNIIINKTKELMGSILNPFVVGVLTISALCSLIGFLNKKVFKGFLATLFNVKLMDLLIRVFAAVLSYLILFKIGPEMIWSADTGSMMMNDVVSNLIPFFFWAGMFLPLLTQFGLMEFVGNLMRPIMRPLFKLPGRSAVNCAVAWVGSGTMGIVLTNNEYEDGHYTTKEAVAISTGFSIASIAIVALLCSFIGMTEHFLVIYLSCIAIGLIMNAILIRIPPISRMPDQYYSEAPQIEHSERPPEGYSLLGYSLESAMDRAEVKKGNFLISGLKVTADIWFTLEPVVLLMGTVACIIVYYTPIMRYLSMPLMWLMNILGLQETAIASQSIMLGGIDLFLPFITGASLTNLRTRYVLAVVAILQIIFFSETGPLLMKLKNLQLNFLKVLLILVLRTVLALLLVTPLSYLLF